MIKQRDKFSFSEYFYAIDWSTFWVNDNNNAIVDAIWFKKTKGEVAVCSGTLSNYDTLNKDDFIAGFKYGRYGGATRYKWNGTEMWSHDNNFLDMIKAHEKLDPILENFPNIPHGYQGWYCIKEEH